MKTDKSESACGETQTDPKTSIYEVRITAVNILLEHMKILHEYSVDNVVCDSVAEYSAVIAKLAEAISKLI